MGRKDKSALLKWFSISRHQKRSGAKELTNSINTDFNNQKKILINGNSRSYTHGSDRDLSTHIENLRNEFTGDTELHLTHATIIVLIRREYKTQYHFNIFNKLWKEEGEFLLKNLNTRWLISAADTFADHSSDPEIRALSLAAICLFNTVKLEETERYLIRSTSLNEDEARINSLKTGRVALFDGTSAFAVGTDDTIRNMRWRIDKASRSNIAGKILLEIFLRLQNNNTVYKRFKERHTRKKTGWW